MPTLASAPHRRILVTGATGQQGREVVRALIDRPPSYEIEILALTRNASSNAAKALAKKPNVTVIEGDLEHVEAIFEKAGGVGSVWGVFSVQTPSMTKSKKEKPEEVIGCDLVDASIKYGVRHFVQTSVDRGGVESDKNPTNVPHFISKHKIELHLQERTQNSEMTYTILRPVAFMENLMPNFIGRTFGAMWANMGDKKLQLVACKDIGVFAAQALSFAETDEYKNTAISLAGDELTQAEGNDAFYSALHRPMPRAFGFVGNALQWMVPELGTMFQWFVDVGYGADIQRCRKYNSGMLDLATWLKEESTFKAF